MRTYGGTRPSGLVIQPDMPRFDMLHDLRSAPAYKLPGKQLIHAIANLCIFDEDLHFLDAARLTVYDVDGLWTRRVNGQRFFQNLDMFSERLVYSQFFVPRMTLLTFVDGEAVYVFSVRIVATNVCIRKTDGFSAIFAMTIDAARSIRYGLQRPVKLDGMHVLHLTSR